MRIAFYYIVPNKDTDGVIYNEGIAVLSALAKSKGAEVSLQMIDSSDYQQGIKINLEADVHAISFPSLQFPLAEKVIKQIASEKKNGLIVVGGVHATVNRESIIELPEVDMVVSGEGEESFCWLLDNPSKPLTKCQIPNVHIRGNALCSLEKASYQDINNLPYPDRSLFDLRLLKRAPEFILSRGCPFACSYCINEFLDETFGVKIRRKSPEYCMGEFEDAFKLIGIPSDTILTFHDDVFLLSKSWLHDFGKLYKTNFQNPFRCNTTASAVTEAKAQLLKEMNCAEVWIGVETGNEEFRMNILKKKQTNEQIVKAFDIINKYGLKGVSFNLHGCPGETTKHLKETIELNMRCKPYSVITSMFIPFHGTSLREGEEKKNNLRQYNEKEMESLINTSSLINKNVSDKYYFYHRNMLRFKVENKLFKYYLALVLKTFSVNHKLILLFRGIFHKFDKKFINYDRNDK